MFVNGVKCRLLDRQGEVWDVLKKSVEGTYGQKGKAFGLIYLKAKVEDGFVMKLGAG